MHDMAITQDRVVEVLVDLRRLHGTADKKLSREKAARRADIDARQWTRWERRETMPGTRSLERIADAYEIPFETFDDGNADRSKTPLSDRLDRIEALLVELHKTTESEILPVMAHLREDLPTLARSSRPSARRRRTN